MANEEKLFITIKPEKKITFFKILTELCIYGLGFIQSKNNRRDFSFLSGQMFSSPLTYWDDIRSFAFHYYPPPDQTQQARTQPNITHMVKRMEFAVTVHFSERGRFGQSHKVDMGLILSAD